MWIFLHSCSELTNRRLSLSRYHDGILSAYKIHRHWCLCQGEMELLCESWQDLPWKKEHIRVNEPRTRRRPKDDLRRVHLKPLCSELTMKAEKVTAAARQLLVSPVDRTWPRGLPDAVLELAQNPTHDWLFAHKANSQTRRLSTTLLAIVPPLTSREGCISVLLHKSVTHILNLHHLTFSFMWIMCKNLMQRTFCIGHLSCFYFLPTLIPPQRVSHCPFSNYVGYALLRARKVLPIQGFPFCITRLFLRHTRYYTTDKGQRWHAGQAQLHPGTC